jgi:hypothetical protein
LIGASRGAAMSEPPETLRALADLKRFVRGVAAEVRTGEERRALDDLSRDVADLDSSVTARQRAALAGAARLAEVGASQSEGWPGSGSHVQHHLRRARASAIFGASLLSPRRPEPEAPPAPVVPEAPIATIAQNIADGVRVGLGPASVGWDDWFSAFINRRER